MPGSTRPLPIYSRVCRQLEATSSAYRFHERQLQAGFRTTLSRKTRTCHGQEPYFTVEQTMTQQGGPLDQGRHRFKQFRQLTLVKQDPAQTLSFLSEW